MNYVIGSGPSGVSVASALQKAGKEVTVLDVGHALEGDKLEQVNQLANCDPDQWPPGATDLLTNYTQADQSGIPMKFAFGSDFAYRPPNGAYELDLEDVDVKRSFAKGGLSNVWGGAILPYRDEELGAWPVGGDDLEPHYRAILEDVGYSMESDALEELLPLYAKPTGAVPLCSQMKGFLKDLEKHSTQLEQQGIYVGRSRLAVDQGCRKCGLCIYGCPYKLIQPAQTILSKLLKRGGISYESGVLVKRLFEDESGVGIEICRTNGQRETLRAARVFLACGVLSTTAILMDSMKLYDHVAKLVLSEYFLMPFFRFNGSAGIEKEALNTLSQVFMEILDPALTPNTIHMQWYGYNDLYRKAVEGKLGILAGGIRWPVRVFLEHLFMTQIYLHSDDSSHIECRLDGDDKGRLRLKGVQADRAGIVVRGLLRKLSGHRKELRGISLSPLMNRGKPGAGAHYGGTFPMSESPGIYETDILGRPFGWKNVHAVDSTVFPSIASTTITLTVMANAHRIGSAIGSSELI